MLDSGTSEDNFFCFVHIADEFVKDSPVSDVIKFDINTNTCSGTSIISIFENDITIRYSRHTYF